MIVDVPVIKVDKVEVEVDDLTAQVAVVAEVRRLAELSVGAVAHLDKVELEIDGSRPRRFSMRASTPCTRSSIASP